MARPRYGGTDDITKELPRCLVSHPAQPHILSHDYAADYFQFGCFTCGDKDGTGKIESSYYYCTTCDVEFHDGCHMRPRQITHPYHLQHPLTLTYRNPETRTIYSYSPESISSEDRMFESVQVVLLKPDDNDIIFDRCTWCGQDLKGDWFYRCSVCSFCLDFSCSQTAPLLTIPNPKNHPHSLLFFPRPVSTPCDACGLVNLSEPSYVCFQCNYMAHQSCIDLPRVIKITRHPHRLSYIPYRSPVVSSCKICYKNVDIKYGQYSCNQEGCSYVAHSKCATHENVWDGTEHEWETEEESAEDIAPFKKLTDGFIKHFCHEHPMKLKKEDGVLGDTEKQCRACIFPIVGSHHQFYHCEECDYSLHEVCASLSWKLDHALHNHTLILDPSPGRMYCAACSRSSTGFKYICSKRDCIYTEVDVRCISVPECFTHKSHDEHLIFISTSYSSNDEIICKRCKKRFLGARLQCTESECEFALCYPCGTIPNEIHYKFDKHLLTLSYGGESTDNMHWCEVCEKQLDPREWFYTCNKCCTTVHLQCIFGSSYFMKPGTVYDRKLGTVKVIRNSSTSTRPFCYRCGGRCTGYVYYQGLRTSYIGDGDVFCSLECELPGMTKRRYVPLRYRYR